ncbi:MAG: site-2 protease family protein [Candidatus Omnitrophota bacterium]
MIKSRHKRIIFIAATLWLACTPCALAQGFHDVAMRLKLINIGNQFNPMVVSGLGLLILMLSVMTHEFMHGWMAFKRGDPTAQMAGRLSFNPLVHIDPFGSILLPAILIMTHSSILIGWAKPVPINPMYFRNPRKDNALVSLAGPLSNIILGLAFAFLLFLSGLFLKENNFVTLNFGSLSNYAIVAGPANSLLWTYVVNVLQYAVVINFILAGLNLLPIPPLDGSHILAALLPLQWAKKLYGVASKFGFLIIAFLAFSGLLSYLLAPALMIVVVTFAVIARYLGLG